MNNQVTLTVNGQVFSGWLTVEIAASIEQLARSFSVSVAWPRNTGGASLPIVPGDLVEVKIGSNLVVTGYVDSVPVSFDATSITRTVAGRSRTADLVDCSAILSGGQVKGQKIEKIAAMLAEPYGIEVITQTDTGPAIPAHQIQQGETVYSSLDRLTRARQLYMTDDAQGRLVLVKIGQETAAGQLTVGENVLSGSMTQDHTGRFSEYIVKGQSTGSDTVSGEAISATTESITDPGVKRRRVLVVKQSGQANRASCRNRAVFERDSRAGKSLKGDYVVSGWRQPDGALWQVNQQVKVIDAISGFNDSLVISEVKYKLDEGGMTTEIAVAPAAAFSEQVDGDKTQTVKTGKKGSKKKGKGKTGSKGSTPWAELAKGV